MLSKLSRYAKCSIIDIIRSGLFLFLFFFTFFLLCFWRLLQQVSVFIFLRIFVNDFCRFFCLILFFLRQVFFIILLLLLSRLCFDFNLRCLLTLYRLRRGRRVSSFSILFSFRACITLYGLRRLVWNAIIEWGLLSFPHKFFLLNLHRRLIYVPFLFDKLLVELFGFEQGLLKAGTYLLHTKYYRLTHIMQSIYWK